MSIRGLSVRLAAGALLGAALVVASGSATAALSGAIFTTEVDETGECTGVNINHYDSKLDVYLDGGPAHIGDGTQLPDGSYYVQVTDPSGANVLGSSVNNNSSTQSTTQTPISVVDGHFEDCYQLWAIVSYKQGPHSKQGYKDTTNNGGVYKVWISTTSTFENSTNKTDNFKVRLNKDADPATLTVRKFYDADRDGTWDADESEITGWMVNIDYPSLYDLLDGTVFTPWSEEIPAPKSGTYTYVVSEIMPAGGFWVATTPTSVTVNVAAGGSYTVVFGNYAFVPADVTMHTKGFWHNQNGAPLVTEDDLAGLRALCLVDGDGNDFDPTSSSFDSGEKRSDSPGDLSPWLIDGGSGDDNHVRENFAQQLAAFYLNVQHYLDGGADFYLYAPGYGNTGPGGDYISGADLLSLADEALCDGYDSGLHELLDDANNDLVTVIVVSPTAPAFSY